MWPCKEALIRIGSPATNAIKNRFFIVGNPSEQYQLFSMLCEIEGGALIAYWLREVRHMVPLADMSKIDSYIRTAEELAGQQETADVK